MKKSSLTTGKFAQAINPVFQCSDNMVREWCEQGLIPAKQNPLASQPKWKITKQPEIILHFLTEKLQFSKEDIELVTERFKQFGVNFNQLRLALVAA